MREETIAKQLKQICDDVFEFGSPWTTEQFLSQLRQENTEFIVQYCEEDIIGFMICQTVLDEAELLLIAVSPEYQSQGVATELLKKMMSKLTEKNVSRVFLEVRLKNSKAIRFYDKHQFKEIGVRKKYYKQPIDDAKLMQLEI